MLKMSFSDGTLNRGELRQFIKDTDKKILFTYGLTFRNPATNKKEITKEDALEIVSVENLLDAKEYQDYLFLNAFSSNDLY